MFSLGVTHVMRKTLKARTPLHTYETRDNGAKPYIVQDFGNHVIVLTQKFEYDSEGNQTSVQRKQLLKLKYKKIFVGANDLPVRDQNVDFLYGNQTIYGKRGQDKGNSILLQTGAYKYVYVGDGIREFSTRERDVIQHFYSPVGNNDVPYSYAVGDKYTYLLIDKLIMIPNDRIDTSRDAYNQYYGHSCRGTAAAAISGRAKTLHKRFAY
jgi:hypothetical protein